ncbi:uncharacterized protein LACBIDRAFT_325269 [Laccaria bicolor S238N-H82]|uniref:Predicted protein n=1 Tax=Laccaria bicolor (strain S238N-H82 / ATCC MYA-4686) TaxID=486041 RepID=B0D4D4_LACBS|nr:uncharacterized protein LACBIDRAFT_325269 [Laccaria bicolor S238N-H82]EDR10548.1 predicted protein [Laccaria bicolor S238N-H82]|eukprot:XP_001878998.1 predicted protein [Laccaria bicolor S238N-H82]
MANTLESNLEIEKDSEALKNSSLDGQKATLDELPPELLVHIFEMAQNMFFPLDKHMYWRFPFILGKVSRYWRQVAYGAPTLWSNVDISLRRDLGGLQVYLGRSKDSPIDLNITFTPTLSQRNVGMLIGILQPHYRRCRSIRVRSESFHEFAAEISSILGSMCKGHYPMLQHICVEGFDSEEGSDMSSAVQPFAIVADAVNLTSVHLKGLGLSYCRPPLTAVTQLHLAVSNHPILYTDFSNMLRSCRSLVTLCVYDDFVLEWPTDLHDTHDMPFLRYIRIFGNMLEVSQLLLSISAPDLEGLTIAPIVLSDLTKLERETSNAPRFPALKLLTLAPTAHGESMIAALANACFPGIKLLILPNFNKRSFVGSFKTTDSRPFWPELDGLAVRRIDDRGALFQCALALAVLGSLVIVKADPNGLVKESIVGGGGRSMEDTM